MQQNVPHQIVQYQNSATSGSITSNSATLNSVTSNNGTSNSLKLNNEI